MLEIFNRIILDILKNTKKEKPRKRENRIINPI